MPDPTSPLAPPPAAPAADTRPASWQDLITAEATKQQVDPRLALAVAGVESGVNPAARSPKGALGVMQLMPETARRLGVDPNDPVQNIRGGIGELRRLLDENKGDVVTALRRYNASPGADPSVTEPYVQAVLGRLQKGSGSAPAAADDPNDPSALLNLLPKGSGVPSASLAAQPPPKAPDPATFEPGPAAHFLQKSAVVGADMANAFNPLESQGRRNLAGAAGAAGVGAMTGGMAAIPAAALMIGGAGTAGGLETALEGNDSGVPGAFREQAGQEAFGQGLAWPLQAVGRRLLAGTVSTNAREALAAGKQAVLDRLEPALNAAQDALRTTRASAARGLRGARASASAAVSSAQESATRAMEAARFHAGQGVRAAEAKVPGAPPPSADLAAATSAYDALAGTKPPSASQVGKDVQDVITGPATDTRNRLGAEVEKAAAAGPDVDVSALKAEAQKILDKQLQPSATAFPHKAPEAPDAGLGEYAQMVESLPPEAQDAVRAQLAPGQVEDPIVKHPVMAVLQRIANAEDRVPFAAAHQFKRELDDALLGTADRAVNKRVTSMTQHLRSTLRETMSGHEPYNVATANYAQVAQLFANKTIPADLKAVVRTNPEAVVRLVKGNEPTKFAMLHDLLVNQAGESGGRAEGQAAWDNLRSAWTHKNLLSGGIDGLRGRLNKLDPEFADLLFDGASGGMVYHNLKTIADAYDDALAKGLMTSGAHEAATAEAKAGVEAARQSGAQLLKGQRRLNRQGVAEAQTEAAAQVEGARTKGSQQVGYAQGQVDTARQAVSEAKKPSVEERRFEASTLAPKNVQSPEQVGANVMRATVLGPGSIWGGLSLARLIKGPRAADLLEWAAYSPTRTKLLVKAMTSPVPGMAFADLLRGSGLAEEQPPAAPPPPSAAGLPR